MQSDLRATLSAYMQNRNSLTYQHTKQLSVQAVHYACLSGASLYANGYKNVVSEQIRVNNSLVSFSMITNIKTK